MRLPKLIVFFVIILLTVGCGKLNSIYRGFDTKEGKGALIGIKQRAIIVKEVNNDTLVCAEPSPEALSAYAAEFAAKASLPETVKAKLVASLQEGSSYVGLRTATIQLLRDSSYRLCEAYINGALSQEQYLELIKRYQKHMIALLAIEQLTGTIRTPTIAINTEGSAEAARSISDMRAQIDKIETQIKELEKIEKSSEVEDNIKDAIINDINNLKADKKAIEEGIKSNQEFVSKGSATVTVNTAGMPIQRSKEDLLSVARVVAEISGSIINMDEVCQQCISYLTNNIPLADNELAKLCLEYIRTKNEHNLLKTKEYQIMLKRIYFQESDFENPPNL